MHIRWMVIEEAVFAGYVWIGRIDLLAFFFIKVTGSDFFCGKGERERETERDRERDIKKKERERERETERGVGAAGASVYRFKRSGDNKSHPQ